MDAPMQVILLIITLTSVGATAVLSYLYYQAIKHKGDVLPMRLGLRGLKRFLLHPTSTISSWDRDINLYVFPIEKRIMLISKAHNNNPLKVGSIVRVGQESEYDQYLVQETRVESNADGLLIASAIVDYVGKTEHKKTIKVEFFT